MFCASWRRFGLRCWLQVQRKLEILAKPTLREVGVKLEK
jgi:hypothetical protein